VIKSCIFCGTKRPYDYRKLKWHGIRFGNGPSYWCCGECDKTADLHCYAAWAELKRSGTIGKPLEQPLESEGEGGRE